MSCGWIGRGGGEMGLRGCVCKLVIIVWVCQFFECLIMHIVFLIRWYIERCLFHGLVVHMKDTYLDRLFFVWEGIEGL